MTYNNKLENIQQNRVIRKITLKRQVYKLMYNVEDETWKLTKSFENKLKTAETKSKTCNNFKKGRYEILQKELKGKKNGGPTSYEDKITDSGKCCLISVKWITEKRKDQTEDGEMK